MRPYETDNVHVAWLWVAALGLIGMLGLCLLGARAVAELLEPRPRPPAASVEAPDVRLSATPRERLREYRERKEAVLQSYHWIDREGGVARIPIGRAVDLLAASAGENAAAAQGRDP